jgi:hypothetical protein
MLCRRCNTVFAILCLIAFTLPAFAQTSIPSSVWNSLVDDFLDQELFPNNPTLATQLGVHAFDAKLEDFSRSGIEKHVASLKKFEVRTAALDPKGLSQMETADREMLLSAIRSELLSLQVIRTWEKDPDTYSTGAANSIYVIMSRNFASPDDRLRSVVAREKQFPQYFAAAFVNLKNTPKISAEIALEQLPGTIDFFVKDVPAAFVDARDSSTKADFAESNAAAIAALRAYENWLKSDLLPRPTATSASVERLFRKNFYMTIWSRRRSTACWKSAWPTCTEIRWNLRALRMRSILRSPRRRCSRNFSPCIPRPISSCRNFAILLTARLPLSMNTTSSRCPAIAARPCKKLLRSNAPRPWLRWIRPAHLKKWQLRRTSM